MFPTPFFANASDLRGDQCAAGSLFGVIGYAASRPADLHPDCPFVTVNLPPMLGGPCFEAWAGPGGVAWAQAGRVHYASNGHALFGIVNCRAGESDGIEALTMAAYHEIFSIAGRLGYPHLLRVFNYLPHITDLENGTERYRQFNAGRYAAFEASGRIVGAAPAACALGTASGDVVIYFISAASPGDAIENPRQVSAYNYPRIYGRRSPSFSRAMRAGAPPDLFISGTASIVGHESLHNGDVSAQTDEALRNLQAILGAAGGTTLRDHASFLSLKAYVRHKRDAARVESMIANLPQLRGLMMLQAEICRPELLVEIEGFCALPQPASS